MFEKIEKALRVLHQRYPQEFELEDLNIYTRGNNVEKFNISEETTLSGNKVTVFDFYGTSWLKEDEYGTIHSVSVKKLNDSSEILLSRTSTTVVIDEDEEGNKGTVVSYTHKNSSVIPSDFTEMLNDGLINEEEFINRIVTHNGYTDFNDFLHVLGMESIPYRGFSALPCGANLEVEGLLSTLFKTSAVRFLRMGNNIIVLDDDNWRRLYELPISLFEGEDVLRNVVEFLIEKGLYNLSVFDYFNLEEFRRLEGTLFNEEHYDNENYKEIIFKLKGKDEDKYSFKVTVVPNYYSTVEDGFGKTTFLVNDWETEYKSSNLRGKYVQLAERIPEIAQNILRRKLANDTEIQNKLKAEYAKVYDLSVEDVELTLDKQEFFMKIHASKYGSQFPEVNLSFAIVDRDAVSNLKKQFLVMSLKPLEGSIAKIMKDSYGGLYRDGILTDYLEHQFILPVKDLREIKEMSKDKPFLTLLRGGNLIVTEEKYPHNKAAVVVFKRKGQNVNVSCSIGSDIKMVFFADNLEKEELRKEVVEPVMGIFLTFEGNRLFILEHLSNFLRDKLVLARCKMK